MKYDLIIDGTVIANQTYKSVDGRHGTAGQILADLKRRIGGEGNPTALYGIDDAGNHAVFVRWDRVRTVEVRVSEARSDVIPAAYLHLPEELNLGPTQIRHLQDAIQALVDNVAPHSQRKVLVLPPGAKVANTRDDHSYP